jgi:hypothetical protein
MNVAWRAQAKDNEYRANLARFRLTRGAPLWRR